MRTEGKNFFLIGGYSCGNPGDEAILKATVRRLNRLFPGSTFDVWTEKKSYQVSFEEGIPCRMVYWDPFAWRFSPSFAARAAFKLYNDLFPLSRKLLLLFKGRQGLEDLMKKSDQVIFIGGGYINSYYSLVIMNLLAHIAQVIGKPFYLLGQTLGPFNKKQHYKMAGEIFTSAQKIVLRDIYSDQELPGYRHKVLYGADDAIGFSPSLNEADRKSVDRYFKAEAREPITIGLNLLRLDDSRQYYKRIAKIIENFATREGRDVRLLFIPMETSASCDDRDEAREFQKFLPSWLELEIVQDALSVEARYGVISRVDLFIGMRLHSLAFSLSGGVPTIGLYHKEYYQRKICGLFKAFNLDENALLLETVSSRLPYMLEDTFVRRADYRNRIVENRDRIENHQTEMLKDILQEEVSL